MVLTHYWTILLLQLLLLLSTLGASMEQVNLGYSTKNVPTPSKKDFLQRMISSSEKFIRSIRWRTFFFLNPKITTDEKETYGFNSTKSPPKIPELKELEDGMMTLIQNIEFKNTDSRFQKQLSKDTDDIKKSDRLLIAADKTTNFYKVGLDQHNKLLQDNITKDYKKATPSLEKDINKEDKKIATGLKLDDRIDTTAKSQAFITLKDHKPNFKNKPKCRLINPTKSEIGKISKQILERINTKTRAATNSNQWKNTNEVLNWYNRIDNKNSNSFICFDVCEFYPSISEDLLNKALDFASKYDRISDHERHIITHAKQSILYDNNTPWCKKANQNFDVTMGSFDGAETCELVGLYILSELKHLDINVGIYRDDGLAVCDKTPRQIEMIKKEICNVFATNKLKITIEANLKTVDFLDITMDLRNATFKPYMKPNNTPLYVHRNSNHPPNIIKNIPESINKRLSSISSNEATFNAAAPTYQKALDNSGYQYKLNYNPTQNPDSKPNTTKRKRKRNITWFNPPFSDNVTTNIGKQFLNLIDKCFPKGHQLHKILNRNTVKVSYGCMPNIQQIISSHNKSIVKKNNTEETPKPNCNCRKDNVCPLNGNCLESGIIYQATVKRNDNSEKETYIGLTDNTFKTRYNGHTCSFRNIDKRNATTLSQHIWTLKDNGIPHSLEWRIIAKAKSYSTSSKKCNLCIKEKYFIMCRPEMATLNSRNELASECRHRKKFLLSNLTI